MVGAWSTIEASRIGGGPVVAMNVTADHAQHGHELAAMVRRVSEPPHHHPRPARRTSKNVVSSSHQGAASRELYSEALATVFA